MSLALYLTLLRQTFDNPSVVARRVTALLSTGAARWLAFGAVVTLNVVLGLLGEILFSFVTGVDLGPTVSPVLLGGVQGALLVYSAAAMAIVGRQFGGQGRFGDAFALIVWVQAVMVAGQIAQMLVMLMFPIIGVLMTLVLLAVMLWLISVFTAVLHGFDNMLLVGAGVLTVFFGSALLFGSVLLGLGLTPETLAKP